MKKGKEKKTHPPPFSNHPHHQRNNSLKKKTPNPLTLKNNQTSLSHATQKTIPGDSPHPPQKNPLSQSTQKYSFEKQWNYPILPSPKKILLKINK